MEWLISSSFSSSQPHAQIPRSPLLPSPRLAAAAGGGRAVLRLLDGLKPKHPLCGQPPPSLDAIVATSLRHGDLLAATAEETPRKVADDSPWAQFEVLLRRASAAAFFLLIALITSTLHCSIAQPAYASVQSTTKAGGRLITTELLSSGWAGFFAGCLHTLSGPDHLAALAPLSIGRSRLESALVGALWGCGHDAGQVIFGLLFLVLKDRLHIEVIRTWGTRVVGLTLLIIGGMGIREASEIHVPCVALEDGECDVSGNEPLQAPANPRKKKIGFATFATGIVHGLQPDALLMVLPALALPSRLAGAAFLGMFLVGTVFAMGSYTVFIGSCSQALKERVPRITEKLTWAASLVAIFMGIAILIGQFFGFSLY